MIASGSALLLWLLCAVFPLSDAQPGEPLTSQPPDKESGLEAGASPGLPQDSLLAEWEKYMEDFVPDLLLTVDLPSRTDEFFYEDVVEGEAVTLRGGFFASSKGTETESPIDFIIHDPSGNVIFKKKGKDESLFHVDAKQPGTYVFIMSNHQWMEDKMVTFAVGKQNSTHVKSEHLDSLEERIKRVDRTLIDIQTESTYLWIRQRSHMKAVEGIHARVLSFCLVEFLILVGISGFQVYYIKGLLSDRRIL